MSTSICRYVVDESVSKDTPLGECRLRPSWAATPRSMLAWRLKIDRGIRLLPHDGPGPASTYQSVPPDVAGIPVSELGVPVIRSNGQWKAAPWLADVGPLSDWHAALITAGYQRVPGLGYLSLVQVRHLAAKRKGGGN